MESYCGDAGGQQFLLSWDRDHSCLGRGGVRFRIVILHPCLKGEASKADSDKMEFRLEGRRSGQDMGWVLRHTGILREVQADETCL